VRWHRVSILPKHSSFGELSFICMCLLRHVVFMVVCLSLMMYGWQQPPTYRGRYTNQDSAGVDKGGMYVGDTLCEIYKCLVVVHTMCFSYRCIPTCLLFPRFVACVSVFKEGDVIQQGCGPSIHLASPKMFFVVIACSGSVWFEISWYEMVC
jgi:hypothetical protein